MKCPIVERGNLWSPPPVERKTVKNSEAKLFLFKGAAGIRMERRLREEGSVSDGPKLNPAQVEAPRPDNIADAMVCLQTGA